MRVFFLNASHVLFMSGNLVQEFKERYQIELSQEEIEEYHQKLSKAGRFLALITLLTSCLLAYLIITNIFNDSFIDDYSGVLLLLGGIVGLLFFFDEKKRKRAEYEYREYLLSKYQISGGFPSSKDSRQQTARPTQLITPSEHLPPSSHGHLLKNKNFFRGDPINAPDLCPFCPNTPETKPSGHFSWSEEMLFSGIYVKLCEAHSKQFGSGWRFTDFNIIVESVFLFGLSFVGMMFGIVNLYLYPEMLGKWLFWLLFILIGTILWASRFTRNVRTRCERDRIFRIGGNSSTLHIKSTNEEWSRRFLERNLGFVAVPLEKSKD